MFNRRVLHFQPYSSHRSTSGNPTRCCLLQGSPVSRSYENNRLSKKDIHISLILKLKLCKSVLVSRVPFATAFITSSSSKWHNMISYFALPRAGHTEDTALDMEHYNVSLLVTIAL